ncbi:MAG: DUF4494 domain-containing protein [Bacteroidaceae bacterium]|jgi:hypothetical protein|nr:DUF4494 domain-containing protein [Bacteroidaceae bacterium]MBQ7987419.1 DUF4494 domain-containing protein [Bacteroidaceae bacterium]
MLTEWFECKVRYDKTLEDGIIKRTMETYLVDAFSFTEAEKRFIAEIEPFVSGEYMVTDIKRAKISELFESDDSLADRWFKAKVAFVTIDEKTGKEKRAAQTMMVQAIDLRDAVKNLDKGMAGTLGDYVIVSVAETKIMDVFRYKVAEGEEA